MSIKITNGNAADEVAPQFSAERMVEVQRIINQYPEGKHKSALMRILHMAEEDFGGWLSVPTMNYVAGILNIQPIEVYEVATFYTMFNIEKPGKVVLEVCRTGPCMLVGSDNIIDHLKQKLGVEVGGTSADGMFTLKTLWLRTDVAVWKTLPRTFDDRKSRRITGRIPERTFNFIEQLGDGKKAIIGTCKRSWN